MELGLGFVALGAARVRVVCGERLGLGLGGFV